MANRFLLLHFDFLSATSILLTTIAALWVGVDSGTAGSCHWLASMSLSHEYRRFMYHECYGLHFFGLLDLPIHYSARDG